MSGSTRAARPSQAALRVLAVIDVLGQSVEVSGPEWLAFELETALVDLPKAGFPQRHLRLEAINGARDGDGLELRDGTTIVLSQVPAEVAVATIVWRLNAIAAASVDHIVVHAGGVSDDDALLIPGSSGAGKSWLTAALVRSGLGYLSDEHAAIDVDTGLIVPMPKPLDLGGPTLTPASSLRPDPVAAACSPGAMVFPRYRVGASCKLVPLDAAAALVELCTHSPSLKSQGAVAFRWLAGLAMAVPAVRASYGNGDDAVAAIANWRSDHRPASPVTPASVTAAVTATTTTIEVGSDLVVFDSSTGSVHHLNSSAGLIWLCTSGAEDRSSIVARVTSEVPDGALELSDIEAVLDRMCEAGLLPTVHDPDHNAHGALRRQDRTATTDPSDDGGHETRRSQSI